MHAMCAQILASLVGGCGSESASRGYVMFVLLNCACSMTLNCACLCR